MQQTDLFIKQMAAQERVNEQTQLYIRRAVIYDNMPAKSDMLKVRVLPEMIGYSVEDLPNYAYFNPTEVIKGVSEKDCNDINTATKVWVVCTSDYLTGWVMCEANDQYNIDDTGVNDAWGFSKFKEHLLRCHLNVDSAVYSDLKVLFSNVKAVSAYNEAGISSSGKKTSVGLDVVNVRTGERFMMLQSGTTFAFTQDQIYLRVGSPDKRSSFIRIQAGSIELTADKIILWGRDKTSLGKHGFKLCGMLGAATGLDGSPLVPLLDITC